MSDMSVGSTRIVGKQFILQQKREQLQNQMDFFVNLYKAGNPEGLSKEEYDTQLQLLQLQINQLDIDIAAEKERVEAEIQNLDGWGFSKNDATVAEKSDLIMTPVYKKQVENAKKQIEFMEQQARYAKAAGNEVEAVQYEAQIELWKMQMHKALESLSQKEKEILEQMESDLRSE